MSNEIRFKDMDKWNRELRGDFTNLAGRISVSSIRVLKGLWQKQEMVPRRKLTYDQKDKEKESQGQRCMSMGEHFPSQHKALDSVSNAENKNSNKNK